ncbi:hypothetical protein CVT26_006648, partial [Gymnopilus dilepis]
NWRAAVALLVSITPTLPGLINNINPKINVGNASFLFDVSWLYGFFSAGAVYLILSKASPAHETFMDRVILGDDDRRNESDEEISNTDGDRKEKAEASLASL